MGAAGESRLGYWLLDPLWGAVYHATYHGLRLLSCRTASALGARLGLAEGRKRYAEASLRAERCLAALRPDLAPQARAGAVDEMWRNVGRVHCEMPVIDRLWAAARIDLRGAEVLERALASRRPVVFAFSHLGNWELLAVAIQRAGFRLNVVYEDLRNRFERALANRSRRRLGYRLVPPTRRGTRELYAALARGEAVGLAIDEFKNDDVRAPAFGRPPAGDTNLRYAMRLAQRFDALVLPTYCLRTGPLAFTLHFLDELPAPEGAKLEALCESWIRAHPEQWYMLWRLRPEALAAVAPT